MFSLDPCNSLVLKVKCHFPSVATKWNTYFCILFLYIFLSVDKKVKIVDRQ